MNKAGISRPSRKSDKVTAIDAAENERLQGTDEGKYNTLEGRYQHFINGFFIPFPKTVIKIEGKYDILIKDDELEGTVVYKD